MARRKRKSSRRRSRRKGMSEGTSFMSAGRKSRRRKGGRKRRRGLSESFSTSNMHKTGKAVFSGLMGGGIANLINMFEMNGLVRAGVNLGASFIAGTVLDAPNLAAGMSGAYGMLVAQQIKEGGLKENHPYADENILSEYPQFADAAGNPMFLADDGNLYYLDENVNPAYELSQNNNLYPAYVNQSNY